MTKIARVREIEIAYNDEGNGAPVVLLHGFPFNRSMWREQVDKLSDSLRIVAPDLRGHGETTVTDKPATMDDMAEDVAALIEELGIERAIVGGLSMGGYVALAFYRKFPERVRALVLADTRPQADTDEGRRTREETARLALDEGMEAIAEAMLPKLLAASTREGKPEVVARVRKMIIGMNPRGAAAALRGMALRRDHTFMLPEINVPTLIVVGNEDALTPASDAEAMLAKVEEARLVEIEGAGHVSNIEQPEKFNLALDEFLAGMQA